MINGELVANPVLEEIDESTETLDERSAKEGTRERSAEEVAGDTEHKENKEKDPFDEIDFGSYFQDYLDPGYRTTSNFEELDKPSFEQFLSQPSTLTDHLLWQLGSLTLRDDLRTVAELIIGNLNEDGYLTASAEELADSLQDALATPEASAGDHLALVEQGRQVVSHLDPSGIGARDLRECLLWQLETLRHELEALEVRRLKANTGGAAGRAAPPGRRYSECDCQPASSLAAEKGHTGAGSTMPASGGEGERGHRPHSDPRSPAGSTV